MSKKIILNESQINEIIEFVKNTYQCSIGDIINNFHYSRQVLENNLGKDFLQNELFHGCKDSTKEKLREFNLGKVHTEEEKKLISIGVKETFANKPYEEKREAYEKGVQSKISRWGSWENYVNYVNSKSESTLLERYGDSHYNNHEQAVQTNIKKYGVENPMQCDEIKERSRQAKIEKYGDPYYCDVQKCFDTKEERYGDPHYNNREKWEETVANNYGDVATFYEEMHIKRRETCLELYGDEFYSNHEQAQSTMMEKYGVPFYVMANDCRDKLNLPETKRKRYETMHKNNTFHTSKDEVVLYEILVNEYGEGNVVKEYQDIRYANDDGYMFKCDFYIKPLDVFIELNYHPTHGLHPFDKNNDDDNKKLSILLSNPTQWNKATIDVWTIRDVQKRDIAIKNKLRYIALYPIDGYDNIIKRIGEL